MRSNIHELILVRHANPEIRPDAPASQWQLSDLGRQRSRALGEVLHRHSPTIILTSPELKAVQTAEILAEIVRAELSIVPGLEEHHRDTVTYTSQAKFEASVTAFFEHSDRLVYGEESAQQALLRFSKAIDGQIARQPKENPIVVSHGSVLSLWVGFRTGRLPQELWAKWEMPSYLILRQPDLNLAEGPFSI